MSAYKIFLMDECDYVAAIDAATAQEWYERTVMGVPIEDVEEVSGSLLINEAEEEGDSKTCTLTESVDKRLAAGETLPFIVGTDGAYA